MSDCCTRIQSQVGHGFFIFHSSPHFNRTTDRRTLASTFPTPFNTHKPCLHLRINRYRSSVQCLSSSSATRNPQNPVSYADYLVRSLGLSHESALKIRERRPLELKSASNADSVLALFRDYGFSDTHMAKIFSVYPELISYNAHKTVKPKLDFFAQNGISGDALVLIVTRDPTLLMRSLRRVIAPCFDFLHAFFGEDSTESIVSLFSVKSGTWVLHRFSGTTAPNVEALRRCGVPDINIVKLFLMGVKTLCRGTDEFLQLLKEVHEMGFHPRNMMFLYGLRAFSYVDKQNLVSNLQLIKKSFGWSDEEVQAFVVKHPNLMAASEEKLKEGLELFMNRIGWTAADIAKYPSVLSASFDTKVYPRLSVIEILMSKGLVKKTCLGTAFMATEGVFLRTFVERYKEEIPHLLKVYKENMS